jgi:hypothetical protein
MTATSDAVISPALVQQLVSRATANERLAGKSFALHLTFGLHDRSTGERAWLRIDEHAISGGMGDADTRFELSGDTDAWRALAQGTPINRLLRQGRVEIRGDARSCIQNWLAVYLVTSGAQGFGE